MNDLRDAARARLTRWLSAFPSLRLLGASGAAPRALSLRRQIVGLTMLTAALSIAILSGTEYLLVRSALERSQRVQAAVAADDIASRIERHLARAVGAIDATLGAPAIRHVLAGDDIWLDEGLVPRFEAYLALMPEIRSIELRTGRARRAVGPSTQALEGVAAAALAKGAPAIASWREGRRGGFRFAVPLRAVAPAGTAGESASPPAAGGVLAVEIDLSRALLPDTDQGLLNCEACTVTLRDAEGLALLGGAVDGETQAQLVRRLTVSSANLPTIRLQLDLAVLATGPSAPHESLRTATAVSAVVMALVALAMACWTSRLVAAPIRRFADAARRVAAAPERSHAPIRDRSSAELASLSESFALMLDSVARSRQKTESALAARTADLQRTEHRLESIVSTLQDVVYSVLPDRSRFLYLSSAIETLSGRRRAALADDAQHWYGLIHPADRERLAQAQARLRPGRVLEVAYRIRIRGDQERWVLDRFRVHEDPAVPGGLRIDGLLSDITRRLELERAQAVAVDGLRMFRRACASTHTGLAILDCSITPLRIVFINAAFKQMLAMSDDDPWLTEGVQDVLSHVPDVRERLYAAIARAEPIELRALELIRRDGQPVIVDLVFSPVPGPGGRIDHYVASAKDITERIASQRRALQSSARVDTILALSPDGVACFDAGGGLVAANPSLSRMLGVPQESLLGMDLRRFAQQLLAHSSDPTRAPESLGLEGVGLPDDGPSAEAGGGVDIELTYPRPRVLRLDVRRSDDEAAGTILYLRDVTHDVEIDRLKSEFLSTAAHELRTPMASVRGYSELLLAHAYDPATQREMVGTIHRQALRLSALLDELLDLARIESRAGRDFVIAPCDITDILGDTFDALSVGNDPREVVVDLPDELPRVLVDPAKIRQALLNVLSNAYKYSPGGGEIRMTIDEEHRDDIGHCVRIVVTDHGIGMTPEQLAKVFVRFYRADPTGRIPGTGLGLALVKEIVSILRGTVDVASRIGEGTSVTIRLPAVPGAPASGRWDGAGMIVDAGADAPESLRLGVTEAGSA